MRNMNKVSIRLPYVQRAINARTLLDEIHLCADCDKDTFISYVNALSAKDWQTRDMYERIPEIDILFHKIQMPGMFQVKGMEGLGADPYIMHRDIDKVIKL